MRDPIVAGADGSARADMAVEWAADEAARRDRPLLVVHAAERWEYDVPFHTAPGLAESLTETGERILAEAAARARKVRPGIEVGTELIFETPAFALRVAGKQAFEVVVGSRGLGGLAGMLLGSTSLKVAGHVRAPVVVVRGDTHESRGEVVVGVDWSELSEPALRYAFETAGLRGAWVHAVHVWRPLPAGGAYPVAVRQAAALAQERLADTIAPWRERYPEVRVIEQTPSGRIVAELITRTHRADLLVIGSRGHEGVPGLNLGSVGHGVLHHADCPVAVVRSRDHTDDRPGEHRP